MDLALMDNPDARRLGVVQAAVDGRSSNREGAEALRFERAAVRTESLTCDTSAESLAQPLRPARFRQSSSVSSNERSRGIVAFQPVSFRMVVGSPTR